MMKDLMTSEAITHKREMFGNELKIVFIQLEDVAFTESL